MVTALRALGRLFAPAKVKPEDRLPVLPDAKAKGRSLTSLSAWTESDIEQDLVQPLEREALVEEPKERKSRARQEAQREQLRQFLQYHHFTEVNLPRASSSEEIYPIHVAAWQGNYQMLRVLLAAGADPGQRTSKNRTAEDFAWMGADAAEGDPNPGWSSASHDLVLGLLQGQVQIMGIRDLAKLHVPVA